MIVNHITRKLIETIIKEFMGVDEVQWVSALPSDASSHTNTMYIIQG